MLCTAWQRTSSTAKCLQDGCPLLDHMEKPVIGDGDQGVNLVLQANSFFCLLLPLSPLKAEGLCDHRPQEVFSRGGVQLRHFGDHRCGPGSDAAHTCGQKIMSRRAGFFDEFAALSAACRDLGLAPRPAPGQFSPICSLTSEFTRWSAAHRC